MQLAVTDASNAPGEVAVKLRCGACRQRRILAEAVLRDDGSVWVDTQYLRDDDERSRPHVAARGAGERLVESTRWGVVETATGRYRFSCHPRCGAAPVIRADRLEELVAAAVARGRREVVLV